MLASRSGRDVGSERKHLEGRLTASALGLWVAASLCTAPLAAATFTVNSVGDASDLDAAGTSDGLCDADAGGAVECTLRAAIQEANATAALDTIEFDISGCPGDICVIELVSTNLLPDIVEPVVIDGSTQPGNASVCTLAIHDRPAYRIVLDGDGLDVGPRLELGSDGSTIRGLNVRNFFNALAIIRSHDNIIECNFVGTDETGSAAGPGNFHNAVILGCDSTGNVIGGPDPEDGNLLSANGVDGVQFNGGIPCGGPPFANAVLGNYIGTAKDGTSALGNALSGVSMFDGTGPDDNVIGAMPDGLMPTGNVISANGSSGIFIADAVSGALIVANLIGVDRHGTAPLGNGFDGVSVLNGPTGVQIGGTSVAEANVLSANLAGVFVDNATGVVVEGNRIGTDATGATVIGNAEWGVVVFDGPNNRVGGTAAGAGNTIAGNGFTGVSIDGPTSTGNTVRGNAIFLNEEIAIDLGDDGPTPNDPGDADAGPNSLQNAPAIEGVVFNGPNLEITYSVDSATLPLEIEFFLSDSERDEAAVLLGTDTYSSAGSTTAIVPVGAATPTSILSATATNAGGGTSELGFFGFIFTDGFESGDTSSWTRDVP